MWKTCGFAYGTAVLSQDPKKVFCFSFFLPIVRDKMLQLLASAMSRRFRCYIGLQTSHSRILAQVHLENKIKRTRKTPKK